MFEFFASEGFIKDLARLDQPIQHTVKEKLRFLKDAENPLLFSKKLKGHKNIFRFRAGDYRIVFRLEKKTILLLFDV
jgi:mRNA-degrading endonuclease RelE of RelBE toxin-antitoxin system